MSSSGNSSSRSGPPKSDGKGGPIPQRGGNTTEPSKTAGNSSSIPPHLSFIVRIEPLSPSGEQPRRRTKEGYFVPPDRCNGYTRGDGPALLLRWMGGGISQVVANDPIRRATLQCYQTATVFTQNEDTPHLLAVPFDARERNVRDEFRGWRPLTFNHERIPGTNSYYSYVASLGAENRIAAPGSAHWMPQLLPEWYQCGPQTPSTRVQAGLIGDLPLLLALAAFSTPPTALGVLLNSLRPGAWNPHGNPYPTGHIPERGMVVTVYFDPRNPVHSVRATLDSLQNGEYGPFYGPRPPPSVSSTASSIAFSTTGSSAGPASGPSRGPSKGHYTGANQPQRRT